MVDGINNSSFIDRMNYMAYKRQATGLHGDIRDNPLFNQAGREAKMDKLWHKMGGQGSYLDAKMMAQMQKEANTPTTFESIVNTGTNFLGFVSSGVNLFKDLFGKS